MAKLISYLFHPLIMPIAGAIMLLRAVNWMGMIPQDTRLYIYLIVFASTLLIPVLAMLVYISTKLISDFMMPKAEERKIPLLFTSFMYLIGAFFLQKIGAPLIFPLFLNSFSVVILLCALVSWKWKISTHMAAISALIGLILGISYKWMFDLRLLLATLIFVAGLTAWSRLKTGEHTPAEVYSGFVLGFCVMFFIVRFI